MEEIYKNSACVVIVPDEDSVVKAHLSGGIIRKYNPLRKILALATQSVSAKAITKLKAAFDDVVIASLDYRKGQQEKDLLLQHCLSLHQFTKIVVVDAGVLIISQVDDLFIGDSMLVDFKGDWKLLSVTPKKLSCETSIEATVELMVAEKMKVSNFSNNLKHNMIIPFKDLIYCSETDLIRFTEIDEELLDSIVHGNGTFANLGDLEGDLASILMNPKDSPNQVDLSHQQKDWIAVVGMSCRFPGANSVEEYWELLKSGKNTSEFPSKERVALSNMNSEYKVNLLKCGVDSFDASFFGMSPTEAWFTDVQGRLLLEISWEALEDAGLNPDKLRGSPVGVFFGSWLQEYKDMMNLEGKPEEDFVRKYLGNGPGSVAAKLSYFYGFTGPNIATESGCSSSMMAVDLAVKSLQQRECSLAFAAGANIILQMDTKSKLVWAADGKCKTFDEGGDGYGRGEGVAVLVLKRYTEAVRNQDKIYGVILGSATSQEGLSRSYGSPTIKSETMAMKTAMNNAGISPNDVDYVEAHATGTQVGDPIEAAAIIQAYSSPEGAHARIAPLLIGSGKTNIGHTESCSGLAAIIKVLLAMKHEVIPPHVNLSKLNPKVNFSSIPGTITLQPVEWKRATNRPRMAGVSNFGITGTDVHMIIQDAPNNLIEKGTKSFVQPPPLHVVALSAKTQEALDQLTNSYVEQLRSFNKEEIGNVAYTANACRAHHPVRKAVVGVTLSDIVSSLQEKSLENAKGTAYLPKVCFSFALNDDNMTEQELQNFGDLYQTAPVFKMYMDFCDRISSTVCPTISLISLLPNGLWQESPQKELEQRFCKFAAYFSLYKLWESWGVKPDVLVGYQFGEFVGRVAAGEWKLEKVFCLINEFSVSQKTYDFVKNIESTHPQLISYISSSAANGKIHKELLAKGYAECDLFLEVGFNQQNQKFVKNRNNDSQMCWFSLLSTLASLYEAGINIDWEGFYKPYSTAFQKVTLPHYPFQRKRFWFERKGNKAIGNEERLFDTLQKLHPLLGGCFPNASGISLYQSRFGRKMQTEYLLDHVIGTEPIFPAAGYVELALAAKFFQSEKSAELLHLTNFKIHHPLHLGTALQKNSIIQTAIAGAENKSPSRISINMQVVSGSRTEWKLFSSCELGVESSFNKKLGQNLLSTVNSIQTQAGMVNLENEAKEFYESIAVAGLNYGAKFKPIQKIWRGLDSTVVEVNVPSSEEGKYIIHPILLDAMLQCLILHINTELTELQVPVGIEQFFCNRKTSAALQEGGGVAYILCKSEEVTLLDNFGNVAAVMIKPELRKTTVATVLKAAVINESLLQNNTSISYEIVWKQFSQFQAINSLHLSISEDYTDTPTFRELKAYLESGNGFTPREKELDEKIAQLCDLYVLRAFYEMGWSWEAEKNHKFRVEDLASAFQIVEPLLPAFHHYFGYLVNRGIFEKSSDFQFYLKKVPESMGHVETSIAVLLRDPIVEDYVPVDVISACGSKLAPALQGRLKGQQILFGTEENGLNNAEFYYQNSRFYREGSRVPAKVFGVLVSKLWERAGGNSKILKILEVGGGTGFFTEEALELLEQHGIEYHYVFTDISSAFFARAASKFDENYKGKISYKKLDIEKDPLEQGFGADFFDIVVGVDVFHATKDLRNTLRHVEMVMKIGGLVIIGETNKPIKELDITFGILDGYWLYQDFKLRASHCTISADHWGTLLEEQGFKSAIHKLLSSDSHSCTITGQLTSKSDDFSLRVKSNSEKIWLLVDTTDDSSWSSDLRSFLSKKISHVGRQLITMTMADFEKKWSAIEKNLLEGIIYMFKDPQTIKPNECSALLQPLLKICQNIVSSAWVTLPKLFVGTVCSNNFQDNFAPFPPSATIWGFIRSARLELPSLVSKIIQLDPELESEAGFSQLFNEMWLDDDETEIMYAKGTRYVRRLLSNGKAEPEALPNVVPIPYPDSESDGYCIQLPDSKLLSDLQYNGKMFENLGHNQVLVEVRATSLNFRDVFCVMKPSPQFEQLNTVGLDLSGVITRIGANVTAWQVGDPVFGYSTAKSTLASHVICPDHTLLRIPKGLTFSEAATLPVAFLTAWYCIVDVAKAKAGQTVLIHAASGGVGLVAIQVANYLGLEVIGTAGSSRKRNYLRSLGVPYVYNSRTVEFKDRIMEITDGKRVDIVLNCLTGPGFKEASLEVCKGGGYFVEISKLDIWQPHEAKKKRPEVNYSIVDVVDLQKSVEKEVLNRLEELLRENLIKPLPFTRYSATRVVDALAFLQTAKHIGKVVVEMPSFDIQNWGWKDQLFNDKSTYLITGGKGAIGLAIAEWMVSQGAKYLILVGRSKPSKKTGERITALNEGGAIVTCFEADVTDYWQMEKVLNEISNLPPLRGIHHCSGVLSDRMIAQQTWENFEYVMAPKVDGAYNLHLLTLELPLEFFVVHSSIACTLGNVGQSNYSAANAYMESLVEMRHWKGLKGMAISWGQWDAGLAENLEVEGYVPMSIEQGIYALERCFLENSVMAVVASLKVDEICRMIPKYGNTLLVEIVNGLKNDGDDGERGDGEPQKQNIEEEYKQTDGVEEREALVQAFVRNLVCETLGMGLDEFEDDTEFGDMGMDSLLNIEYFNKIQFRLKNTKLGFVDMAENGNVKKISQIVVNALNISCL